MITIYTDGGSKGNPGPSAWAFVVYKGHQRMGSKSSFFKPDGTNNEAELTAIKEALEWAKRTGEQVSIITDSEYANKGYNQWMQGWKDRHWRTSSKKPVKNRDLWSEIYYLKKETGATVEHCYGHSGIEGNEAADTLCNVRIEEYLLNRI